MPTEPRPDDPDELDDLLAEYREHATTCDYCGELAMKPFPFYDPRCQLGACDFCLHSLGLATLQAWAARQPPVSLP